MAKGVFASWGFNCARRWKSYVGRIPDSRQAARHRQDRVEAGTKLGADRQQPKKDAAEYQNPQLLANMPLFSQWTDGRR